MQTEQKPSNWIKQLRRGLDIRKLLMPKAPTTNTLQN